MSTRVQTWLFRKWKNAACGDAADAEQENPVGARGQTSVGFSRWRVKKFFEKHFLQYFALDVTANCICEIHWLALNGSDLNAVHKRTSKEKKSQWSRLGSKNAFSVLRSPLGHKYMPQDTHHWKHQTSIWTSIYVSKCQEPYVEG